MILALTASMALLAPVIAAETPKSVTAHGPLYRLVNRTGRFSDAECFWSLDDGKEWHSFAKEPTVPCPLGNGRLYFRLGAAPTDFGDRKAYWDFIEYASENGETWHGNTTQVDAFCLPITIEMGTNRVGISESRQALFEQFRAQAPAPFKSCVLGNWRILSPCAATFGTDGPNAHYFDAYIDEVWAIYANGKKTPSGKWIGKVTDGALIFTPVGEGKPLICKRKPTSQDAFMGTGELATNAVFCAAINRHVLADPADWRNPATYYQKEPCNWYAKFLHEHSIGNKAYGFCYDDVVEQAAFFSGKGKEVIITLTWDATAPAR
jgi:hypothetical protein